MIYVIVKHAHNGIRWIALVLLIAALINSLYKLRSPFRAGDRKLTAWVVYLLHLQVIIGLVLYFISPKVVFSAESMSNRMLRFFLIEHIALMILAVVIATVGKSLSGKANSDSKKHSRIAVYYGISLVLILLAIPWPWQNLSAGWF